MTRDAAAYSRAMTRSCMMACITSIGLRALDMVTAVAIAGANRVRLPLIPGDVLAGRRPDPVLQQIENFSDGSTSAIDCFTAASRYSDRTMRAVLADPADCLPVTLAFWQDLLTEAYCHPESFSAGRMWSAHRIRPDGNKLARATRTLWAAKNPVIIADSGSMISTDAGGFWWDAAVPEVSVRPQVTAARGRHVTKDA